MAFPPPDALIYPAGALCGLGGAWIVTRWGGRWGLDDQPSARSSHVTPTPKGGGIGLLAAFCLFAGVYGLPAWFLGPAVGIALLGLLTDRVDISPRVRLVLQFLAGAVFVIGARAETGFGVWPVPWTILLVVFLVGTTNFYNFMDGIDGIAGISGVVAFLFLALAAGVTDPGRVPVAELAGCMACACIGFLPFNFPRARVFMGDVGSLLLGFSFAASVILLSDSLVELAVYAGLLLPFYADELITMAVRVRARQPLTRPHRNHLYQLLANECRIAHWRVSAGYGLVQCAIAALVIGLGRNDPRQSLWVCVAGFSGFILAHLRIRRRISRTDGP